MKTILLSALAILATLTSCNKENNGGGDAPISGKSTYASFSVRVKAPGTYATTPADGNADAVEQVVASVRLFVFNGGVLETMGNIAIDATNTGTTSLKTTTGAKVIYAVANANADMTMTVGQTLDQFKALAVAATPDVLAKTNQFVMAGNVSVTLIERTESEATANPITINQARVAAKAQMQYDPAKVKINDKVKGTFTAPVYQLAQYNTTMFLSREGYGISPKGAAAEQIDVTPKDGTYDHLQSVKYGTPEEIAAFDLNYKTAATTWDFIFTNSVYMAENVNESPSTGNSTFALVRLKYTPDVTVIQGVNKTPNADGTFYAVRNADNTWAIYADKAEADAAQAVITPDVEAKVYTRGECYYRLNIRDITKTVLKEKYAVLRNNFYKINITEVNSIGGNSPIDPEVIVPIDPETPLETETHISADITVLAWTAIEMNEPLN